MIENSELILERVILELNNAASYLTEEELILLNKACDFGISAHQGQTRQSGEPYITHPITVAKILTELNVDVNTLIAAVLHDTIEDTHITQEDIESNFGDIVLHLVEGVTKISKIQVKDKQQAEADSLRKMLLAMSKDIGVMFIKLADRIHNMQTLGSLRRDKQARIATQTIDIFAPIAHRLGLLYWQHKLEDMSFKILYPKRYSAIEKSLLERQQKKQKYIANVSKSIIEKLDDSGIDAKVSERPTNIYGIYRRMQDCKMSFDDIQDIIGLVVTVNKKEDCYRSLGVVHEMYKPVADKIKDYIAIPKINGYQSLHSTVFGSIGEPLQILIRTQTMHHTAELGVASHWKSTVNSNEDNRKGKTSQWLVDFLDTQELASCTAEEFMDHLKSDLFPKEVFLFTPKGDIKRLPKGATVLDFAYSVHSNIGDTCKTAMVNGEISPLYYTLQNGDLVKIITDEKVQPNPSWLDYVMTAKARADIRSSLRHRSEEDALHLGEKLFNYVLNSQNGNELTEEQRRNLLNALNKNTWKELLADIGHGDILPVHLIAKLEQVKVLNKQDDSFESDVINSYTENFTFDGLDTQVDFGLCCHPIPGDQIIGYIRRGKGIKVHSQDCARVKSLNIDHEMLQITWPKNFSKALPVPLMIVTQNKPGVFGLLGNTFAEHNINISRVDVKEKDGNLSNIYFEVDVKGLDELTDLINIILAKDGIVKVTRLTNYS